METRFCHPAGVLRLSQDSTRGSVALHLLATCRRPDWGLNLSFMMSPGAMLHAASRRTCGSIHPVAVGRQKYPSTARNEPTEICRGAETGAIMTPLSSVSF